MLYFYGIVASDADYDLLQSDPRGLESLQYPLANGV